MIDHCSDKSAACRKNNFSLRFLNVVNLESAEERAIESFSSQPVHAMAGIGHPERFFNQLRNSGLTVIEHAFPDHYVFRENDFIFEGDFSILMTEKDAVKCREFNNPRLWYVPVTAKLSEELNQSFLSKVKNNE